MIFSPWWFSVCAIAIDYYPRTFFFQNILSIPLQKFAREEVYGEENDWTQWPESKLYDQYVTNFTFRMEQYSSTSQMDVYCTLY